jgi:hypothetical protein
MSVPQCNTLSQPPLAKWTTPQELMSNYHQVQVQKQWNKNTGWELLTLRRDKPPICEWVGCQHRLVRPGCWESLRLPDALQSHYKVLWFDCSNHSEFSDQWILWITDTVWEITTRSQHIECTSGVRSIEWQGEGGGYQSYAVGKRKPLLTK